MNTEQTTLLYFSLQNQRAKMHPISRASATNIISIPFPLFSSPHNPSHPSPPTFLSRTCEYTMTTRHHQPHVSPSPTDYSSFDFAARPSKRRGSYNCGRCGLPKKGHSCHLTTPSSTSTPTTTTAAAAAAASTPYAPPTPSDSSAVISAPTSLSASRPPRHQHYSHFRRALSFDNIDLTCESPEPELAIEELADPDPESSGGLPAAALWEVLRRLPPSGLLAAAKVCKGWRETARRLWRAAEELRVRVPLRAQVGCVGSVLQKCPGLVRLSLRMERLTFLGYFTQILVVIGCID